MPAADAAVSAEQTSRDKILDAAEALFAKRGYAAIGLRELAEVVGLGKSSLLNHFLLTLVGIIVFPFASREFGAEVLGKDLFDAAEVRRRKREIRALLRSGLVARASR